MVGGGGGPVHFIVLHPAQRCGARRCLAGLCGRPPPPVVSPRLDRPPTASAAPRPPPATPATPPEPGCLPLPRAAAVAPPPSLATAAAATTRLSPATPRHPQPPPTAPRQLLLSHTATYCPQEPRAAVGRPLLTQPPPAAFRSSVPPTAAPGRPTQRDGDPRLITSGKRWRWRAPRRQHAPPPRSARWRRGGAQSPLPGRPAGPLRPRGPRGCAASGQAPPHTPST